MVIFLWGKFGKEGAKCMLGIKLEHPTFSQMLFASARRHACECVALGKPAKKKYMLYLNQVQYGYS